MVVPDSATPVMVIVWVSLRSTSTNVIAPWATSGVSEPVTPGASVIVAVDGSEVNVGASLVPVTVMVTGWVTTPP